MNHDIGFLFDLDGVLIDSEGTYTEFWTGIERRFPTGVPDFAIAIKGTTLPSIMEYFPDPEVRAEILAALKDFQDNMEFRFFPYTTAFLHRAQSEGIGMALVTSSESHKMKRLYEQHPGFRDYFKAVIDSSMVTKSKPDPEGYLKGAVALGLPATRCVVFEDSIQGLKAGRASGARVVALATTYPPERLNGLADRVVSGLDEPDIWDYLLSDLLED